MIPDTEYTQEPKIKTLGCKVTHTEYEQFKSAAKEKGLTTSELLQETLRNALNEQESVSDNSLFDWMTVTEVKNKNAGVAPSSKKEVELGVDVAKKSIVEKEMHSLFKSNSKEISLEGLKGMAPYLYKFVVQSYNNKDIGNNGVVTDRYSILETDIAGKFKIVKNTK